MSSCHCQVFCKHCQVFCMGCATYTFLDFVGHALRVDGRSMEPVIKDGERIWANRLIGPSKLQRGDLILFKDPKDYKVLNVKQVIGLEGDNIRTLRYRDPVVKISPGYCWVEGYNATLSRDSNEYGEISLGLFHAKVEFKFKFWPPERPQNMSSIDVKRNPISEEERLEVMKEFYDDDDDSMNDRED